MFMTSDRFRFDTPTLPVILLGLLLQSYMIRVHSRVQLVLWYEMSQGSQAPKHGDAKNCRALAKHIALLSSNLT